jgi:hypothetical protein
MTPKQSKSQIKAAQAKHLADLFGEEAVPAASAQQAQDHQSVRGQKLSQAAQDKQRQLPPDEAAKLEELKARQAAAKAAAPASASAAPVAPEPEARPAPAPTDQPAQPQTPPPADLQAGLAGLSARNDLADAALRNMRRQAAQQAAAPVSAPEPAPQPAPRPQAAAPASPTQAPAPSTDPDAAAPPRRRPAPSPEELDRLLKAMASRSRGAAGSPRPSMGRGAEAAPDAAPQVEAPPDVPDEAPEKNQEKQAEIIDKLRAKEAQAVRQAPNLPEPDQQRASAEPVEVKVPIVTEDNAVSAAPLHQALEDLAREMGAKNPPGQVHGINEVHKQMPGHPLRDQGEPRG